MIIDAFVGNIFSFAQNVASNQKVQSVGSRLTLQSVVRSNIILQSVGNSFVLRDVPTVRRSITVGHFADALNLSSTQVTGPGTLSVVSTFAFYQSIVNSGFYSASNHLGLSQLVSGVAVKPASSLLTLSQNVSVTALHIAQVASALAFVSQQASFENSSCTCSFGDDPILHNKHPYFAYGNMRVVLRSPEFGNVERVSQNRIMRRSRAGDLIIFRDNRWPATETLQMEFKFLSQQTARQLLDFMKATIGFKVTFFDNEQRTWKGYIMTPAAQVAEQLQNSFSISLEFQGIQTPLRVEEVNQSLRLNQVASENRVIVADVVSQTLALQSSYDWGYGCTIIADDDTGEAMVVSSPGAVANVANDGVQIIHIHSNVSHYNGNFFSEAGPNPATEFKPLKQPSEDPVTYTVDSTQAYWRIA